MRSLTMLLCLLLPSLAWSECPTINGEWLLEFNMKAPGEFTFDTYYVGYLIFNGDFAVYDFSYAHVDLPDELERTYRYDFAVRQMPDCSVLLQETNEALQLRMFPKGEAKARVIAVDGDYYMSGRGVADKKWWRN